MDAVLRVQPTGSIAAEPGARAAQRVSAADAGQLRCESPEAPMLTARFRGSQARVNRPP
jgi:hypothetical protein